MSACKLLHAVSIHGQRTEGRLQPQIWVPFRRRLQAILPALRSFLPGLPARLAKAGNDQAMTGHAEVHNATVAMTGTQESMASGSRLIDILHGLGVAPDHLHVIEPLPRLHAGNVDVIRREIEHRGLSVIVPTRACIHVRRAHRDLAGEPALA